MLMRKTQICIENNAHIANIVLWLPSGLHPILGIAYFSNVYCNIGIILPSESNQV